MTRPPRFPVAFALAGALALSTAGAAMFGRTGVDSRAAAAFPAPHSRATLRRAPACPLTRGAEKKAIEKFKKLLPVVQHPRCINCHGGVNPFVDKRQGGHLGGAIDQSGGFIKQQKTCQECHSELPGWELPPEDFFFVGKDARQLCMQFKKFNPSPKFFIAHMDNDNGKGPPFTLTAFKGDRALNDMAKDISEEETHRRFANEPPPISHDEFVTRVKDWVEAMGDGYVVKPDCGCIPTGSAWVGTVKAWWEQKTPELGTWTATAVSTVRFVIDSSYDVSDDPAEYWKSVGGTVKWETSNIGGKCRINQSGSSPIVMGSDLNPMAVLSGQHDDKGGMTYTVGLGPWPDAYLPIITWHCPEHDLQSPTLGVYNWWYYDVATGMNSPDGKILKGSFHSSSPSTHAVMSWEWDLHLEP